jgi:hypothetical protein
MTTPILIIIAVSTAYVAALLWAGRRERRAPEPDLSEGEWHL